MVEGGQGDKSQKSSRRKLPSSHSIYREVGRRHRSWQEKIQGENCGKMQSALRRSQLLVGGRDEMVTPLLDSERKCQETS